MAVIRKLANKLSCFYKQHIICEQYPFLTSLSRNMLQRESSLGVIYMLHHIAPKDKSRIPTNEDLKVSPDFLEKLIISYKRQGVEFYSLDDIYDLFISGKERKNPFVAFTIDDGYLDNYTNAYPIFKKYNVPFTIFIATDFIDQKAILWWDSLEELLITHESITISDGSCYSSRTFQQRWDAFRFLREKILKLSQHDLQNELTKMFPNYNIDWLSPIKSKSMSWEQVKKISKDPLCTIGGHTITHPALKTLNGEEAMVEIIKGNKRIKDMIQKEVDFFAYPYGTANEVGEREYELVDQGNLKMAFLANGGCITSDNIHNRNSLPRKYLFESYYLNL